MSENAQVLIYRVFFLYKMNPVILLSIIFIWYFQISSLPKLRDIFRYGTFQHLGLKGLKKQHI